MMNSKLLSKGYKQTKVGVIPEDWEVVNFEKVIEPISREVRKPIESYWRLGLRSHGKGTFHKLVENPENIGMDKLYEVKMNDLIVSITFAWEHAIALIDKDDEGKLVSHRFPTYTFKHDNVASFYKYLVLQSRFKYKLQNISSGGAGRNRVMNKKDFLKLQVPLPPLKEQKKIAKILRTWDNSIEKQEQLIEQKELLKKGLMERLLSGEVRFLEFKDKWKTVQVSEKFSFIKTYQNSRKDLADTGEVEYLHYGDIHTKYKYHLNFKKSKLPKISFNKFKTTIEYVKEGDLFIADASEDYADIGKSVEAVNIKDKKVVSGLHTFLLRNKDKSFVNGYKGLIFYNQEIRQKIKKIATGTSVLSISKTNLGKVEIPLPSQKEQHKIAQTLILANKEIDLLKEELSELKNQKKALMQKLLMGEVRVSV